MVQKLAAGNTGDVAQMKTGYLVRGLPAIRPIRR
jgi:hypothetical protein